ncbi:MAG: hypothetical protein MUC96_27275 [Myxococcaceae bacterium]|jgi:hypothetical protein|nr:hypothetical protein [Myxococcaceae bacterium]
MNPVEHQLTLSAPQPLPVPAAYAEKAMASLMQLHGELMDEKERRVELYRRLMEREQALAELKMYVKILEEKVAGAAPSVPARDAAPEPPTPPRVNASPRQVTPPAVPPVPGRSPTRPEGWKVW